MKLRYLLITVAGVLRFWTAGTAWNYSDENIVMCYVEGSLGTWVILQQLFAMFFMLTCLMFARMSSRTPAMMLL